MITAAVAFVVLGHSGQAKDAPNALVSRMLARYYSAKSLTGKLSLTQSAAAGREHGETKGETDVQFERPTKLFVKQTVNSSVTKGIARIVSDGSRFLYSLPKEDSISSSSKPVGWESINYATDLPSDRVLVEDVMQFNVQKSKTMPLSIGEIYNIARSGLFLRPEPLDVAIGLRSDLKKFVDQMATVEDLGEQKIGGRTVRMIGGSWREYGDAPVSGQYQIAVTSEGDLVRYTRKESLAGPPNEPPVSITTTWDVDLQIDGKVNQNLFRDQALNVAPPKPATGKPPR